MAIASYNNSKSSLVQNEPNVPVYRTALINNRDTDIAGLVQYVSGSKWVVTYYSQLLGKDDGVEVFDNNIPDALQQYTVIRDFLILVDTPISPQAYDVQNTMTSTGSGKYYNVFPPNIGDLFTARLINNNIGVFTITSVERMTYNKETVYDISYTLTTITTEASSYLNSLNNKAIRTFYYDKNNYKLNASPLLDPKEYQTKISLGGSLKKIINSYFKELLDTETNLILVPGQKYTIYDYPLSEFLFKVIDSADSPVIKELYRPSINDKYLNQYTIWDAIVNKDIEGLSKCNRDLKPTSLSILNNNMSYRKLLYYNVSHIMYPSVPDNSIEVFPTVLPTNITIPLTVTSPNNKNINISFSNIEPTTSLAYLPDMSALTTYVFSSSFYNDGSGLTILETLVLDYLKDKPIDSNLLTLLLAKYDLWSRLEQYYYAPVVVILIKHALTTNSSYI